MRLENPSSHCILDAQFAYIDGDNCPHLMGRPGSSRTASRDLRFATRRFNGKELAGNVGSPHRITYYDPLRRKACMRLIPALLLVGVVTPAWADVDPDVLAAVK